MNPLTCSGGQVAHHPRVPTRLPASEKRFHRALTRRISLVTGAVRSLPASCTTKWPMPCWSGVLPVAIVVQRMGESIGWKLLSRP